MKNLINVIQEKLQINSKTNVYNEKDNNYGWNIRKAKEGDIIEWIPKNMIFIYKDCKVYPQYYKTRKLISLYASCKNTFAENTLQTETSIGGGYVSNSTINDYRLASEEQCEKFFDLLKQKGYEWDDKNLKLIKI